MAVAVLLTFAASCGNKAGSKTAKQSQDSIAKVDSIVPVQRNILGIELSKTTFAEAMTVCAKNAWDYEPIQNGQDNVIDIDTPIDFGGEFWTSTSVFFYKYKAYMVDFWDMNCTHTKEQEAKRFQAISKLLKKKYPKAKINAKNTALTYTDGTYYINLEIDGYGRGLMLTYGINDKKLDKVIGSDL